MKQLLLKLAMLFIAIYVTIFFYIEIFPLYYNSLNNNRWYFLQKVLSKEIDIKNPNKLFLGESRVNAGIDINQFSNAWSVATGGATAIEMYYALQKFTNNYQKPDTIFLSLSPRSLTTVYSFWEFAVRNNFFTHKEFMEIYKNSEQLENHLLIGHTIFTEEDREKNTDTESNRKITPPLLLYFSYLCNYPAHYQVDIHNSLLFGAKKQNLEMIQEMTQWRGRQNHPELTKGSSGKNYETEMTQFQPSPLLDFYFYKILQYCKENNIFLIFTSLPMNNTSCEVLNTTFVTEYKTYLQNAQQLYPEFYISDTIINYPDKYFGDPSHLNQEGRILYTEYLKNQIFK